MVPPPRIVGYNFLPRGDHQNCKLQLGSYKKKCNIENVILHFYRLHKGNCKLQFGWSTHSIGVGIPDQPLLPVPRALDPFGDHRAACAQAGILRSRGGPLERAAARICREAGARVTTNTRIIDLNIDHVDTQDDRRIEVIANGLPLWGGAQLAVDTTLVSPLTRAGHPRMRGGQYRGTALRDARRNKERTYPELLPDRRCRLVVFGIEVGGRWSDEAATFLRLLAHTKARQAPALLRHSLTNALIHRWSAMLTHAAMHAFAASLLDQDLSGCHNLEGNAPSIREILAEATSPPHYSRLPAPS